MIFEHYTFHITAINVTVRRHTLTFNVRAHKTTDVACLTYNARN